MRVAKKSALCYVLHMSKRRLQEMLDRAGLKLVDLCRDLQIAQSTASRWTADVPGYAWWYAASMAEMTEDQRLRVRESIRHSERRPS